MVKNMEIEQNGTPKPETSIILSKVIELLRDLPQNERDRVLNTARVFYHTSDFNKPNIR